MTEPQLLHACATGCVHRDRVAIKPYRKPPARVAPMDPLVCQRAYDRVCERLKEGPERFGSLTKLVAPLFEEGALPSVDPLVYEILQSLRDQGRLKSEVRRGPGARMDLEACQYWMSL